MTNGVKNYSNDINRKYVIKVLYNNEAFIGYLNGTQNMDDDTVCLKVVGTNKSKNLIKRFLDTRSANCSIAGTNRMLKNCNYIYYFHSNELYTLEELGYDLDKITLEIGELYL